MDDELEMERTHADKKYLIEIFRRLGRNAHGTTVQVRSGSVLGPRYFGASLGSRFNNRGLCAPNITDERPFRTITAALALSFLKIDRFVLDTFDEEAYSVAIHRVVLRSPHSCPAILNAQTLFQNVRELRMDVWVRNGSASDALTLIQTMADSPNLRMLTIRS